MQCPSCGAPLQDPDSGVAWCLVHGLGGTEPTAETRELPVGDAAVRKANHAYVLVASDGSEYPIGLQRPEP